MSTHKHLAQLYNEGDFIDAKDNQGDWRVAYIIQKNIVTQLYKVRFDGWSSKYDEHYKFTSQKLKPFRTHVIGYTGQQKNPAIRENWHFNIENLQQRTKRIQIFINNPLHFNSHQMNQLIRGQNYVFCDFLMTNKYRDSEAMNKVIEFFWMNVKLLIDFLVKAHQNLEQFLKIIEFRKEPQQAAAVQAYYLSYYELFDTAYIIFGNYDRLQCFFKNNQQLLREFFKIPANKDHKRVFKHQITKHFVSLKGIEMIQQILQKLSKIEEFIPFLFLSAFSHLIVGTLSICVSNFKESLLEKLLKLGQQNMKKLKQHQLKELHRKEVSIFIQELSLFSQETGFQNSIEQRGLFLQLNLSLKMIVCPYFERKLKGIVHINEVCQKHQSFISKDNKFRNWIQQNNLFQNLFIINDNLQIIKKSCDLTRFLIIRKLLRPEDIDIIWNSRIEKHQTVLKEIYTLISELAYYEKDQTQNLKLFNKISNIPSEKRDEEFIRMIRVFSTYSYRQNNLQNPSQLLCLGFMIVSQYAIKQASEIAISQLIALLQYFQDSDCLIKFLQKCFLQIQSGNNVKNNIKILFHLGKQRQQNFKKIKIDAINIIQNFLEQNPSNNDAEMINQTFKLLQFLIQSILNFIQPTTATRLWFKFIHSPHRKIFLNWILTLDQKSNRCLSAVFKKTRVAELLLKILWKNDENKTLMDVDEVDIMVELIKQANIGNNKIKNTTATNNVLPQQLHGYQLLFLGLKLIADANAADKICDFIAYLNVNINETLVQQAITSLYQTILKNIKETLNSSNKMILGRILMLMKKTLDYDDQLYPPKTNAKRNYVKEYTISRKDTKEEISVKFNCLTYFYQFKKIVSSKINLPLNKFDLLNLKGVRLSRQFFNKTMIDQVFNGGKFQVVLKLQNSLVKNIFNKNIDILFNLLDDPSFQMVIWNIISRLPLSEELKMKISKSQNILDQIQHLCFYKQLYMFKVLQDLGQKEWMKIAISLKLKSFSKYLQKIDFRNQIQEQFVIAVTNIIIKMLSIKPTQESSISKLLFQSLLQVLLVLFESIQKSGCKNIQLQQKIIKNIFRITITLSKTQNMIERLMKHEKTMYLLNLALITISQQQIRHRFVEELKVLIKSYDFQKDQTLISLLLGKLFSLAINQKNKSKLKEYYTLTSYALSKCSTNVIDLVYRKDTNGLVLKLFDLLKKERTEQSNQLNKGIEGYFILLKHLIKVQKQEVQNQILEYVAFDCLFSQKDPKCKSPPSRKQAFNILLQLSESDKNLNTVINFLISLHKKGKWRSRRHEDWGITFVDKMKSTGYVGIKNLGCICYMNSFIQQLFMIPYFRYSITNVAINNSNTIKPKQNILYQLQKIFMNLQYSDKKFYNPKQFCFAFKDYEGNPTNVSQQMDIDEFSNILFDRIQNLLKETKYPTLIKDMFGGVFSNEIVCKGCPHYSQSEETFLSISLTIKNKKNIHQSFKNMIDGDTLDGDNAYYCERCNKKVNAIKRMSLKKLPNHLIITLKRFQFDYEKMIKLKVNDYFQFPHNLSLKEYSRQFLRIQQGSKTIEEEEQFDSSYFNYVLKGFVIHIGHADSGHYYSIIQDRWAGKWYEFNDSIVRDFEIQKMSQQGYGGEIGVSDARQKIKNAYMVIYQRQKKIPIGNQISWKRQQIKNKAENNQIIDQIVQENNEHRLQNILFSHQYKRYVIGLLSRSQKLNYQSEKLILKFATIYYLTVTVRQKSEGTNEYIMKRISRSIDKHRDVALWIVNLLSVDKIYNQFFINNPYREMRKAFGYWLVHLINLCLQEQKKLFFNSCLNKIVVKGQNSYQLCLILYQLLQSDNKILEYSLSINIIGMLMQNIIRQKKEKNLLPQAAKESQIGYQINISMGLPEQMRLKKLRMLQNENEYIWAIINLIIRKTLHNGSQLRQLISKNQLRSLFLNETKIYKILEQLRNKFAIYQFAYFIGYLTKNNMQFLATIIDIIFIGLRDLQSKKYRQFILLFEQLIQVQDNQPYLKEQLQKMRFACFQKVIQALKHNQQYSMDSNIIQQWIVILLNRNQKLRAYLMNHKQILTYLLDLSMKNLPSDEMSKKNKNYTESMINKLHGVMFLRSKKAYLKQAQKIREFYNCIAQNNFNQSQLWPSSADNYLKKISINDKLAFFDQKEKLEYEVVFVSNIFLGKIELTKGQNQTFSIWKDDERLMNQMPAVQQKQSESETSQKLTEGMSEDQGYLIEDI